MNSIVYCAYISPILQGFCADARIGLEMGKKGEKMGVFVVYIDVDNIDISTAHNE